MKKIFLFTFILFFGYSTFGQSGFVHSAASSNIQNNWTILDHSTTNNNSSKLLFITQKSGVTETNSPLGVWYSRNKWTIFNQNKSAFPEAKFNVIALDASRNTFIHTASRSNISRHITTIDNPATNNNPNAKIIITQNFGSSGPYNKNIVGVWYSENKWKIFNQNKTNMPNGAKFNVWVVNDTRAIKTEANINNRLTNNLPDKLLFATHLWEGVYNRNQIGVKFGSFPLRRWGIKTTGSSIENPDNAKFNVAVVNEAPTTPASEISFSIPKDEFLSQINSLLAGARIRLNNLGDRHRDTNNNVSWYRANDCTFSILGETQRFDIPEQSRGIRDRRSYINDMNLQSIRVFISSGNLYADFVFEEDGTEIKRFCSRCAKFREDRAAPDFQLENNIWRVQLDIIPLAGSISFRINNTSFLGEFDGKVFGELLEGIAFKQAVPIMESQFSNSINARQRYIAERINTFARVAGYDFSEVSNITIEGGYFVFHN